MLVALAALGAATRPLQWQATALVLGVTVLAAWHCLRTARQRRESTVLLRRSLRVWSALVLLAALWELAALSRQPSWLVADPAHPTLSSLFSPALEHGPVRLVGWLAWLAIFRRLVR